LACGALFFLAPARGAAQPPGYVGKEACLQCHEDMGARWARNVHSGLAEFQWAGEVRDCEACHGPGADHMEEGDGSNILALRAEGGREASAPCAGCHKTGPTWDWEVSAHAEADVSCTSCHEMHGQEPHAALLREKEPKLCYGCHLEQKAKFRLPSHHPLREGQVSCTSCHDEHGPAHAASRVGEGSRELCLSCHTQYRGPFIFEHSPVEEGCGTCHESHGAVADHLLRQNEPFLCLNCHQPHFHAGLMAADGEYAPPPAVTEDDPNFSGLSGVSHPDGWKRTMLTKCTQCHPSIHGTDLPSQGIPGQGRGLNR
jgi:DmsE family decaheme c-type cytochrome